MVIEIHIPRPWTTLLTISGIVGVVVFLSQGGSPMGSAAYLMGGDEHSVQERVHQAEEDIQRGRQERALLERKEEILRYQLRMLEAEREALGDAVDEDLETEFARSRDRLLILLKDKQEAELYIKQGLQELWDAQVRGQSLGRMVGEIPELQWPIEPEYGISADYLDGEYEERFGLPHHGIDIPAFQGTEIKAPADGVVERVVDNGYGYSYLILRHEGVATLFGHIESFLVQEGDTVQVGDIIALSGGRPGSRGSGKISTGPHLHFEVIVDGERIDPMELLTAYSEI